MMGQRVRMLCIVWISVVDDEGVCGRVDVGGEYVPVLMAATFLNGLNSNMNTIPMLKI